jgi:hypothetical protein
MIFHSLIPVELVANREAEVCELANKKWIESMREGTGMQTRWGWK